MPAGAGAKSRRVALTTSASPAAQLIGENWRSKTVAGAYQTSADKRIVAGASSMRVRRRINQSSVSPTIALQPKAQTTMPSAHRIRDTGNPRPRAHVGATEVVHTAHPVARRPA